MQRFAFALGLALPQEQALVRWAICGWRFSISGYPLRYHSFAIPSLCLHRPQQVAGSKHRKPTSVAASIHHLRGCHNTRPLPPVGPVDTRVELSLPQALEDAAAGRHCHRSIGSRDGQQVCMSPWHYSMLGPSFTESTCHGTSFCNRTSPRNTDDRGTNYLDQGFHLRSLAHLWRSRPPPMVQQACYHVVLHQGGLTSKRTSF